MASLGHKVLNIASLLLCALTGSCSSYDISLPIFSAWYKCSMSPVRKGTLIFIGGVMMFCASIFCYFGRLWHVSMGLVQVSHISIANALELRLSCTKPLISSTKELPTCYPGTSMLIRVITCCGINTKLMVKPLLNHQNGIPLHWYCNIIENIFLNVDMKQFLNNYRQISNISHTKSQNLNVSCLVLQLSLSNPMKPGVNSKMKM